MSTAARLSPNIYMHIPNDIEDPHDNNPHDRKHSQNDPSVHVQYDLLLPARSFTDTDLPSLYNNIKTEVLSMQWNGYMPGPTG